jgi:hypothetical protein
MRWHTHILSKNNHAYTIELPTGRYAAYRDGDITIQGIGKTRNSAIRDLLDKLGKLDVLHIQQLR